MKINLLVDELTLKYTTLRAKNIELQKQRKLQNKGRKKTQNEIEFENLDRIPKIDFLVKRNQDLTAIYGFVKDRFNDQELQNLVDLESSKTTQQVYRNNDPAGGSNVVFIENTVKNYQESLKSNSKTIDKFENK